ncbi:MAG TPA: cupin domain-containing protein [Acidimicrobiales bacterium]|nr:cupin domain-containing protein [Acidimicrobiales bacterium]
MTDAPQPTVFRYEKPERTKGKVSSLLCRSELIFANVMVVGEGGETNLHSHLYLDGFWFVLRGRVRFYTTDDEVLAELGPEEGILIPRGAPYWFESVGTEELELLQVEASARVARSLSDFAEGRVDYTPPRATLEQETKAFVEK